MVLLSPVLFPPVWGGGNETQAAAFCHLHLSLIPLLLPQGTRGEFPHAAHSPHLRCSSCQEVGGREKHAAGTLKFRISISTSGRGNLQ